METNAKLLAVAMLIATLVSPLAQAQSQPNSTEPTPPIALNEPGTPPADGPGGRHGKHGPGPGRPDRAQRPDRDQQRAQGPGHGHSRGLTSLTTVSGTVGQLTGNDEYILDGFTLNAGSGPAMTVKFPPHLGKQVQQAVKTGSNVSVTGYSETTPKGETFFLMNSLTAGKTTVLNSPPTRPATTPEPPALATATGKIADYRLDRGGRVNGLILDDKTVVTIPPHVAYQLTELAKKGNAITVQGYPRTIRDGQVQLEKVNILRASVLTINGQQYLVR